MSDGVYGKIRVNADGLQAHIAGVAGEIPADPRITEALERLDEKDEDSAALVAELEQIEGRRAELPEAFTLREIDRARRTAETAAMKCRSD